MEFLRNLGPCMDLLYSGYASNNNKIYRVFNSMFELKEHHNKIINKYNLLIKSNINIFNYKLILNKNGKIEEHYYIEEKNLINNDFILSYKEFIKNEEEKLEKKDNEEKNKKNHKVLISILIK